MKIEPLIVELNQRLRIMEKVKVIQAVLRGYGIDIHGYFAVATVGGEGITTENRGFKTFSCSLAELK